MANRTAVTADGNTTIPYSGGEVYFSIEGGFGGGTFKIQISQDGTNWTDSDLSYTAAGGDRFSTGNTHQVRLNAASSTTPTVFFSVDPISQSRVV